MRDDLRKLGIALLVAFVLAPVLSWLIFGPTAAAVLAQVIAVPLTALAIVAARPEWFTFPSNSGGDPNWLPDQLDRADESERSPKVEAAAGDDTGGWVRPALLLAGYILTAIIWPQPFGDAISKFYFPVMGIASGFALTLRILDQRGIRTGRSVTWSAISIWSLCFAAVWFLLAGFFSIFVIS